MERQYNICNNSIVFANTVLYFQIWYYFPNIVILLLFARHTVYYSFLDKMTTYKFFFTFELCFHFWNNLTEMWIFLGEYRKNRNSGPQVGPWTSNLKAGPWILTLRQDPGLQTLKQIPGPRTLKQDPEPRTLGQDPGESSRNLLSARNLRTIGAYRGNGKFF